MKKYSFSLVPFFILLAILVLFTFGYDSIEPFIYELYPIKYGNVGHYDLVTLTLQFLFVASIACLFSIPLGVLIGLFCFTSIGSEFRSIIEQLSAVGKTIPSLALLTFIAPIMGIGVWPAVCVLVLHSMLVVIFATISGIENIPPITIEISRSLGMNWLQIMFKVRIPMALPIILSGIRVSVISCIGATTIAANTGAGGLGVLLFTGMSTYNTVLFIQSAIPISLIALMADALLKEVEKYYAINF